ncbi:MAG: exopolyphosphatase / guanosine-5-triphosphate,3-diphosphate pyrophosphatase, partial [Bacteroidota bacterium]|nr:exopolyphosphatase / guanosine-5-triphosphate,3-diphosphate pyrophosphatase [Bacteroidota bacterium]
DAILRGIIALREYSALARTHKAEIRSVATSAVREAINQNEFLDRVKSETGIDIEVVSGTEEGRLIYNGVVHALPIFSKSTLVIDIGGGSTETIIGKGGNIIYVNSEKLGAIRCSRRFFPDGINKKKDIESCRDFIKGDWTPTLKRLLQTGFENVVGTSGTIVNIAIMALAAKEKPIPEVINGLCVSRDDLLSVIKNLVSAESTEERVKLPGIDPQRADIITAGALILEAAIMNLNIQKLHISSYALREGIVFDTIEKKKAISEFRNLSNLRYDSVASVCQKYNIDIEHAKLVKDFAIQIFDELQNLHGLGNSERELLEAASFLHDVGYFISHDQHHKHSYYIIKNCMMPGFTNDESELIAHIARYHRKSHPKKKHEEFAVLPPDKQKIVCILAGILRIAEGVDRRMLGAVKNLKINKLNGDIHITLIPKSESLYPDIELWGADRRKPLLEETIAKKIEFSIE